MPKRDQDQRRLFKEKLVPADPGSEELFKTEYDAGNSEPVECLGMTFENDQKRREYFLERLRERLKDPEFRKIEGFPIGEDEDILALSDPPYYTACPNPWIADFIKLYGKPYDPETDNYHREPFAADVSEGKNDPIYNAHSYHTKVPHKAIMRYILHYTEPGDIVFDGFCGTGMTGVAAQMVSDPKAIQDLGYRIATKRAVLGSDGTRLSEVGQRQTILIDLSPFATFVASKYLLLPEVSSFVDEALSLVNKVEKELSWLYSRREGILASAVWSDVFLCPECGKEIVYWKAAYSDDSALLFRRKAPGSSEGFGPGFPSDCGHVFRVNRPFCTGRIGA